jgi:hypothetical protein
VGQAGSLRIFLEADTLTELGKFAVLVGVEAPTRQLLALFSKGMHNHPITQEAVRVHAMDVDHLKPAMRAQNLRWQHGSHVLGPYRHLSWLRMNTQLLPEVPGTNLRGRRKLVCINWQGHTLTAPWKCR